MSQPSDKITKFIKNPHAQTVMGLLFGALATSGWLNISATKAWLIVASIVGIHGIYRAYKLKYQFYIYTATLTVFMVSFAWIAHPEKVPLWVGVLTPYRNLLFSPHGGAIKIIEIGNSGTRLFCMGSAEDPRCKMFQDDLIIETIKGNLMVSTTIKSDDGTIVASISRNEWKVLPTPLTYDRNYTDDALEVIDPKGNVILQVKLFPDHIQLQGEWRVSKDLAWRLVSGKDNQGNPAAFIVPVTPKTKPEADIKIQRMFTYPSELHFGELMNIP